MKALVTQESQSKISSQITELPKPALREGEVLIQSEYSSLNYKDALGVSGQGRIYKSLPMIGGIDVAGTVIESRSSNIKVGDFVLVTGCGLGETHNGGYSEFVVERAENIIKRNSNLSAREAMIYGTAGFTAALCLERMLQNGQRPEMGTLAVTGASGGVGQFAVYFFSKMGFEMIAITGKPETATRLQSLGAQKIISASALKLGGRPLETIQFGGAIDNVGGPLLSQIMSHTQLWGSIACVGLADRAELETTVMPLILRGVSLLGISSNNTPLNLREKIWQRLSSDLKPDTLNDFVSEVIGLNDIPLYAEKMLGRKTDGRILVDFNLSKSL